MAKSTQSDTYAAQVAAQASFAARTLDARTVDTPVKTALIKVPVTADNVATDVITLIELPPGAIVLPEISSIIVTDDMTSGALTIDIGDSGDPDRYCDGANCASVGVVNFLTPAIPAGFATRTATAETASASQSGTVVTATLATFTATIEAGEFYVSLAYKTL